MRSISRWATVGTTGLIMMLPGCGLLSGCGATASGTPATRTISSVTPSATGSPNSIVTFEGFEYVSVQGTGQIFIYKLINGAQEQAGSPYATPCVNPSGMAVASVAGSNVMAVVCYDTGSLLTLTVRGDGSLSPLGSVGGLSAPFPGVVLDGTDVYVPLFGQSLVANGGLVRISLATPASPVVTGMVTLASPVPGGFANPGYAAAANGYIYLAAGSESAPSDSSSTIQVVDESTMQLVGSPIAVAHSPQQLAIAGGALYVTFFDAMQLESFDLTNPASPQVLETLSLSQAGGGCNALSIAVQPGTAYVGCYGQGGIEQLDITDPASMRLVTSVSNVASPQRIVLTQVGAQSDLLVTDSDVGGSVYQIPLAATGIGGVVSTP